MSSELPECGVKFGDSLPRGLVVFVKVKPFHDNGSLRLVVVADGLLNFFERLGAGKM